MWTGRKDRIGRRYFHMRLRPAALYEQGLIDDPFTFHSSHCIACHFTEAMEEDGATTVDDGRSLDSSGASADLGRRQRRHHHGRQDSTLSHCSTVSGMSNFSTLAGGSDYAASSIVSSQSLERAGAMSVASSSPSKSSASSPRTPSRSKLRTEYHARLSSPTKRPSRWSPGESPSSSPSSTHKRDASPVSARRYVSAGEGSPRQ